MLEVFFGLVEITAGEPWSLGVKRAEFRKKVAEGEDDYAVMSVAKKEDAPGIYWAYANLGKWSVAKGFTTVLKNKSKLKLPLNG